MHVGDVEALDRAGTVEDRHRALGIVGVDVDAQRVRIADDQHRVADVLEQRDPGPPGREPSPETTKFVQYR